MNNYEQLYEALTNLEKTYQELVYIFEELLNKLTKSFESLTDMVEAIKDINRGNNRIVSPKEYGISLLQHRKSKILAARYCYIPQIQRNLPYQRRKF